MKISHYIKRLWRDESGNATVEFTLWLPMLMGVILLGTDASMMFTQQSNYWSISHNTARMVARHALDAETGAAYAREQLNFIGYTPEVDVAIDDTDQTVTVKVVGKSSALAPFGMLDMVMADKVAVEVTQSLEPL